MRFVKIFLFAFFLILFNPHSTAPVYGSLWSPRAPKIKYNLSVCSLFNNEAPFLKEWIEYHLLMGVEHFYLYNNRSSDFFYAVLRPYIKKGIVSLINWPDVLDHSDPFSKQIWPLSTQIPAYEHNIHVKACYETDWLVFLDVDEFLVTPHSCSLSNVLRENLSYAAIFMNTTTYETVSNSDQEKALILENFTLACDEDQKTTDVQKMIFQPSLVKGFCYSPYQCLFNNEAKTYSFYSEDLHVNRYTHRKDSLKNFAKTNPSSQSSVSNRQTDENILFPYIQKLKEKFSCS